ncbi:hypothetical protein [Streptomyces enissocaesilis]|uniref:Gram-positive cocci surface proteins LPxTG domain-containing protein n=1 Tax=Streptomyces enissocaesilis TaxID=332589 RepID=A0ABN3XH54_9ACTN
MSARRPLLTATAAGTLLCALWFVPSANATAEKETPAQSPSRPQSQPQLQQTGVNASQELALADTGSVDTTPYLLGGTAFLGVGAGFLVFSTRRAARPV